MDALRPLKAAQKSGPGSRSNAPSGGSGGNDRHDSWGAPRDAAPEPAAGAGDDGWNDNDWDDDDSWGKAAPKAKAKAVARVARPAAAAAAPSAAAAVRRPR